MKKGLFFLFVVVVALAGCAAPRQYSIQFAPIPPAGQQGGYVPVVIQNPALLEQEVLIFWGSEPADVVPDPRTGGWMYNRPAFKYLRVGPAYHENSWHNYVSIMLPRNSNFILAGRTMNFWGKGSPYFIYFSTASNPFAYQYTLVTPSRPQAVAGGLVTLQNQPITPFGHGPLNLNYTIDLRSIGPGIANSITNRIWGR